MQPIQSAHALRRARAPLLAGIAACLAAAAAFGGTKPSSRDLVETRIAVEARPLAGFDKADPQRTRFGRLVWRGGLVLTSPSPSFGGWSGLALGPTGESLLAVSDAGAWMTGRIAYDGRGRPIALQAAQIGPLRELSGAPLRRGADRDAEDLTLAAGTLQQGRILISFERNHRIGAFDIGPKGLSKPKRYIPLPAALKRRLHANSGLEAIATLQAGPRKGALVAFAETLHDAAGNHVGWIWEKQRPREFYLTNPGDYAVTAMAPLPDGGLLVLERRFRWNEGVKTRLRLLKRDDLHPGAHLKGETLLDVDFGKEIDNMEGLAVHAGKRGETVVTLISDDNFNKVLQRTLLLQFVIDGTDIAGRDAPAAPQTGSLPPASATGGAQMRIGTP